MQKIYRKEVTEHLAKTADSLYNTSTDFSALKREIETNITEGGKPYGTDLSPQGGLPVSEPDRTGQADEHWEVRDAAQDLPEREPEELVSEYADERQAESASGADQRAGGEPDGGTDREPEREVSGSEQGNRTDGMGGTPEQSDRDGGRDRAEGIGVQLTADTTEQDLSEAEEEIASAFSLPSLPTVEQQIRAIEAPMQAQYADEITIPAEVVDEILRTGSNRNKSQLRLIYNFMTEQTPEAYRSRSYQYLTEHHFQVIVQNYQQAYFTKLFTSDTPEMIRKRLEEHRPKNFRGRPFGVGDVIVINQQGEITAYFVDKDSLVVVAGFIRSSSSGILVTLPEAVSAVQAGTRCARNCV